MRFTMKYPTAKQFEGDAENLAVPTAQYSVAVERYPGAPLIWTEGEFLFQRVVDNYYHRRGPKPEYGHGHKQDELKPTNSHL